MNDRKVTLPLSEAAKNKMVEDFENPKKEGKLKTFANTNFFNKYVCYMIVPSPRTAAAAGVKSSVIAQLQQRQTPDNFFGGFLRACSNSHEDGSLIVLDSGNGADINRRGVDYEDGSIIELHSCNSDGDDVNEQTVRFRINDDQHSSNRHRPALCMIAVSLVQILFYTWDVMKLKTTESSSMLRGPMTSTFIYNPNRRRKIWPFLTYAFVHVGQTSLVVNLMVQLLLGVPLETVHRGRRVATIYFSGVLAGSLATSISDPSAWLAGASGGVYALIAAHVVTVVVNWSQMKFAIYQMSAIAFLTTLDVVGQSLYGPYVHDNDRFDFTALLAGAVTGLLVGVYTLRHRYYYVRSWENELCWFCFVVYATLIGSSVAWNVLVPEYFTGRL